MDFPHDPHLLTLAFLFALLGMVLLALLIIWLRSQFANTNEPPACGAYGLCRSHHDCLDHQCPGHPCNSGQRGNVVRLHTRSGSGERVDTSQMKG